MARQPDTNSIFSELGRGHVVGAPGEPPFENGFRDFTAEDAGGPPEDPPKTTTGLMFCRVGAFLLLAGWWALDPVNPFDLELPIFTFPPTLVPRRGFYSQQSGAHDLYFESDGRVLLADMGDEPDAFAAGGVFTATALIPLYH